jgi:transposase-like protein
MPLDKETRNLLAKTVAACRRRLAGDVTDQLRGVFGLHPDGTVLPLGKLTHLSPDQHAAARRLRDLNWYSNGGQRKRRDTMFKVEAVKRITEQGYKTSEAARNWGIHPSVMNRWKSRLASEGKKRLPRQGASDPRKRGTTKTPERSPTA